MQTGDLTKNMKKPRMKQLYEEEIIPGMMDKFQLKNKYQVPKLKKIVINMGIGEGARDFKLIEEGMKHLAQIAGQKPVVARAKKSISNFKIRKGHPVGCMVTLRGDKMYEFLDRLINVTLPRIKDFRGINPNSFDGEGNFTLGLREQTVFPEIEYDEVNNVMGMNISIVIESCDKKKSRELLKMFNTPFKK
jgi:large subunit ribosomal protein L5